MYSFIKGDEGMEIEILEIVYGSDEYINSLDFRNAVFRQPWGLDIKDDNLEEDKAMEMYGAYIEGKLIGTVFLTEKSSKVAQIKTVGVRKDLHGIGLGNYLMLFVEDIARQRGYKKIYLMARVYAENFYKKLGYKSLSKPYNYKIIPHLDMEKEL